ncbi:MAG: peptidoglycan DD-metalloendopeptidase family protein [Bacillota bacterium]|jgi:murein DD-endopeptidase MepM/ murein hydrolase activator NlpD|nr:M23 family metallopeptidase [Candidatus Fermentithermobacillaceae bacterium]
MGSEREIPNIKMDKGTYRLHSLGLKGFGARRRRSPRRIRSNIFFFSAVLTAFLVFLLVRGTDATPVYAVKVGGTVVGYTDTEELHTEIVDLLVEAEGQATGTEVVLDCEITCEKVEDPPKDLTLCDGEELAASIRDKVSYLAKGYVISVDGVDIVALCSEEEARGVLADLRANYVAEIAGSGDKVIEEVLIKENVGLEPKSVSTDMFRNREEAVRILTRGTDKVMNYVVQRGDSLWAIANANGLTLEDILKANPTINADLLQIGQNLNLVVPDPYVTLASREVVTYTVSIPYSVEVTYDESMWPWQETVIQAGRSGSKEITQEIIRENGKEMSRVTLNEKLLSYPVTKKISRGSKQVPPMGSEDMVWPIQGTITSHFGWRWGRMHEGVDIGAKTGTEVLAADSGMVSFAGWNGNYGYLVKIDHGGGKETRYAHLSKMAVKTGDTVTKGKVIGYVGSTGRSTGPHLHFEVRINGTAKNPLGFYE